MIDQTSFPVRGDKRMVEGVSLNAIADEFGTPSYIYSAGHIRAQYGALSKAINAVMPAGREALICYACKANSNLAILSVLAKLGCGLEVVSEGELLRGLRAGIDPQRIVSTGVGKQDREIKAQIEAGIYNINVESLQELEHIQRIANALGKVARVIFRLNPDVAGGANDKISTGRKCDKFGLVASDVFKGFECAAQMSHVEALGLMVHIGSQVTQVEAFDAAFGKLPALVRDLRAAGHKITRLDIGGGFPVRYREEDSLLDLDAYAAWVRDFIVPLDVDIALEPGRYMVANAGILLTRVIDVKPSEGRRFLIIDAAINDLVRPAMYEAYHGISPAQGLDAKPTFYDVVGPVCETGDTFARQRSLPAMARGDLALIHSAGAYGYCMSSSYNTRPRPAEILVDGGDYALIRPRETYEDLMGQDIVPDFV